MRLRLDAPYNADQIENVGFPLPRCARQRDSDPSRDRMAVLEITTVVGCRRICSFCPQHNLKCAYPRRHNKYLSLDDFKTILDKVPPRSNSSV